MEKICDVCKEERAGNFFDISVCNECVNCYIKNSMNQKSNVVIIMGSRQDLEWCNRITHTLNKLEVESTVRIASAHKVPLECLRIIKTHENNNTVFLAVAGRSNALGGFVDAQTSCPVITCPPYSETFSGADIYSSLRMPSWVAPMVILEPENAACAAAKILGICDKRIKTNVEKYQQKFKQQLVEDDKEINKWIADRNSLTVGVGLSDVAH